MINKAINKAYGSIAHLPGSRQEHNVTKYRSTLKAGKDYGIPQSSADICLVKTRDKHDQIIVQEKLDGANVAVVNIDGNLIAVTRSGNRATSSKFEHHNLFARWVNTNLSKFNFLQPGERVCGEWLALAHGTLYKLKHDPFVAFDIFDANNERLCYDAFINRIDSKLVTPALLSKGPAVSIQQAISLLNPDIHGALEEIEGCVWRVERQDKVLFLAKYVRPTKIDGKYLPDISGKKPIWLWHPDQNETL